MPPESQLQLKKNKQQSLENKLFRLMFKYPNQTKAMKIQLTKLYLKFGASDNFFFAIYVSIYSLNKQKRICACIVFSILKVYFCSITLVCITNIGGFTRTDVCVYRCMFDSKCKVSQWELDFFRHSVVTLSSSLL